MKKTEIGFGKIYRPRVPLEDDVFAYIRGWKNGEVGFSVLDYATRSPDFSNCGVFWVHPEDFRRFFEETQ